MRTNAVAPLASHYQPHFSPLFCSFSHARSGAKYSSSADASALRLAAERRERLGPRLARAEREHRRELRAGLLVAVDRARVERARCGPPPCRARGGTGTGRCARGSSGRTACSPGRGTSRPDRSPLRCARPAARRPGTCLRSAHQASLYFSFGVLPEKTSQRHLSMSRPNGRKATLSSAIFICRLMRALSLFGTVVEQAEALQVRGRDARARACRRCPRGSRRWRPAGRASGACSTAWK